MAAKKPKWKEGKDGIDGERAHLKTLAERLHKRAKAARAKGHPVHARALEQLADKTDREYKRLTHVDKLSGLGDVSPPNRPSLKWIAAVALLGFLAGKAS